MANTLTGLELWEPKVRMGVEAEGSARGRIPKGWDAWLGDAPVTGNSVRAERGHPAPSRHHGDPRATGSSLASFRAFPGDLGSDFQSKGRSLPK